MLKSLTGNLEQQVINVIWAANKPLKPSEVKILIEKDLSYSTIKTVLERLAEKGFLKRKKDGNVFIYSPKITKNEYASKNLKNVFENIISYYGHLAISQFVQSIKNDKDSRDLLKKYLEDNEK